MIIKIKAKVNEPEDHLKNFKHVLKSLTFFNHLGIDSKSFMKKCPTDTEAYML